MRSSSFRTLLSLAAAALLLSRAGRAQREPAPYSEEETVTLSEFQVTSSPDDGYRASNALSGTRFNTALIDLPKPVDVITSEFIADIGAIDLSEAVAYSGSITQANASANDDITGSNFNVRGFNTFTTYRNGFRQFGIIDPINIDRIEIIKGPSSVFSGPIEPGGTINVITKRPSMKPSASLAFRYATYDTRRVEATATGPLNDSRTVAYRLATAISHTGYQYDFSGLDKQVVGGGLSWKISDKTNVVFEGQFVNNRSEPVATARIVNNARTGYVTTIPDTFNRNGPQAYSNTTQYSGTIDANHRFNDMFSLRAGLYYRYQSLERLRDVGSSVQTAAGLLARTGEYEPHAESFALNPSVNLLGSFKYGEIKHRLIMGYEYYYERTSNDVYRRTFTALNPAAPNYDLADGVGYNPYDLRRTYGEQSAYSVSNLFTLLDDRLLLLQGIRVSETDDERKRLNNYLKVINQDTTSVPNYGVSYKLRSDLTVFASYSESYLPVNLQGSVTDAQGRTFPPSTGKGVDYGVKFDLLEGRISGNVTGYEIDRENTLIPDIDNPGFNISEGLTKVKGVDTTVSLRLINSWRVLAGYSYTDGVLVNGSEPNGRIGNVPMHKATMWNTYKFRDGAFKGLSVGLGMIYV
ncbi:MAG TPA: TonB-dependent receptor, partial [Opitutaceae bacterium]